MAIMTKRMMNSMDKYERLTKRDKNGFVEFEECEKCDYCGSAGCDSFVNSIIRLAELEDDIESGKLIRLPCMIQNNDGEWLIYFFNTMFCEIDYYKYDDKEEAKATLKELKGEV